MCNIFDVLSSLGSRPMLKASRVIKCLAKEEDRRLSRYRTRQLSKVRTSL